jgi:hypothetical protein
MPKEEHKEVYARNWRQEENGNPETFSGRSLSMDSSAILLQIASKWKNRDLS